MTHTLGTRTSGLIQKSVKESNVLEIVVNHNGGMGGGRTTFYCDDNIDLNNKNGLFEITTIIGNSVFVNTQWISTIKRKRLIAITCDSLKWDSIKREYKPTDVQKTLYYVINKTDDYNLVGSNEGSLSNIDINF